METKNKYNKLLIIYLVLLLCFSIYILLDTFVISKVYIKIQRDENKKSVAGIYTENTYVDENISVTITKKRQYDSNVYIADIKVNDAKLLKTALAQDVYGKNILEETSKMAERNEAIIAINGDYYAKSDTEGVILRNGVLYREKIEPAREYLIIGNDGSFDLYLKRYGDIATYKENARQILSFGPSLVYEKYIRINPNNPSEFYATKQPRTAIGIIDDLHYVFVVVDGRTKESKGTTLYELATIMKELNVEVGYNLDGGGSSTMCFMGKVLNKPTYQGVKIEERQVSDIVYIGY